MSGLLELVKGNKVRLRKVVNGNLHYALIQLRVNPNCRSSFDYTMEDDSFTFVVPREDTLGATFPVADKSELYMKWIKQALDE